MITKQFTDKLCRICQPDNPSDCVCMCTCHYTQNPMRFSPPHWPEKRYQCFIHLVCTEFRILFFLFLSWLWVQNVEGHYPSFTCCQSTSGMLEGLFIKIILNIVMTIWLKSDWIGLKLGDLLLIWCNTTPCPLGWYFVLVASVSPSCIKRFAGLTQVCYFIFTAYFKTRL